MSSRFLISALAVSAAVCALLTAAGLLLPSLLSFGVAGVGLGIVGVRKTLPKSRVVFGLATFGVIVSGSLLIGGTVFHVVRYRSESPPGYERIDFGHTFQANETTDIPHSIRRLLGRKVCLKGYAFSRNRVGIEEFVVTPDGNILIADRIVLVQLRAKESWEFNSRPIAVSGTLTLSPDYTEHGLKYLLTDATVRVSMTPFGVLARVWSGC